MALPDSQQYLYNCYQINYVEDIVVFLGLQMLNSDNFHMWFYSRNALVENNQVSKLLTLIYIIYTWLDKASKGTSVSRALSSLHGGSLELKV